MVSYDVEAMGESSKWTVTMPSYGLSDLGRTTLDDTLAKTLAEAKLDERSSISRSQ
jgi:hypothetical protein